MPFLAFDLDAFENCVAIAQGCGLRAEQVSHGLLMLWRHCWRSKTDHVTTAHLKAFFAGADVCEMLLTFGHLEASELGWRVRGAAKYLKVTEARSANGKANSGNLKRGTKQPEIPGSSPVAPRQPPGSAPALTANSQQPLKDSSADKCPADVVELKKPPKPKTPSRQQAFFAEAQRIRCEKHPLLQPERVDDKDIPKLNANLKRPLDAVGVAGATAAWLAYLDDQYAADRRWPWGLFISDWERHHAKTLLIGVATGPPRVPVVAQATPNPYPEQYR